MQCSYRSVAASHGMASSKARTAELADTAPEAAEGVGPEGNSLEACGEIV